VVERHLAKVNVARSNRVARFSRDNIAVKKYILTFSEFDYSAKIKL
jgi:hypothetical protein